MIVKEGKIVILGLLFLCITFSEAQQGETSLDDLINKVFKKPDQPTGGDPIYNPVPNNPQVVTPDQPNTQPLPQPVPQPQPQPDLYRSCGFERECVPRFLCKNDTIISDGTGIIDIRMDPVECKYLETCCDIPNKTGEPIIPVRPPVQHTGCGYVNPDGVGFKIVGGEFEAQFGEFPWMVAILREEQAPGEILNLYECGGALIAPTVVLTASHCVQTRQANTLIVRAGEWDTQTKDEVLPHQDRRVKEIILHEHFNKGTLFNDVALLIVETPFVWEENVRPICLPDTHANFDYSRCYATGWGKDTFGREGTYQVILKKIDLPVVPRDVCQSNLRKTRLGKYFTLNDSFICAGGEKDKDTCKGDGGSPLVCPHPTEPGRYYQAGIVAWGIGCGEVNVPGVYANVPYLRQWINEKLIARNIDFSHFTA